MTDDRRTVDRGGGIHVVRRSDLRVRNLRLSFNPKTGDLEGPSPTAELRTDIFDDWLRIAERASDDSEAARRDALEAPLDDNEAFTSSVQREFEASMIAVAASAFALDAFFASVVEHAPEVRISAESRDAEIFETFKRAFALSHARFTSLREPLRMIFDFVATPFTLLRRGRSLFFTPCSTSGWNRGSFAFGPRMRSTPSCSRGS